MRVGVMDLDLLCTYMYMIQLQSVVSRKPDLKMDSETSERQGVPYLFVCTLLLPTVYILDKFFLWEWMDIYLP